MEATIRQILEDHLQITREAVARQADRLEAAADLLSVCLAGGHKILLFGQDGGMAQARSLADQLVGSFQVVRHALPAMALSADTAIRTKIAGDFDFSDLFARQIEALGRPDDVAWALCPRGGAPHITAALHAARRRDMHCIGFTGPDARLAALLDIALGVDAALPARVLEVHTLMGHVLIALIERTLFPGRTQEG
jgi:D-sedoheptulose 7-phosphate isomerase